MDRTAPATHSGHDELLIARLYGDDVDDAERALALDLMADCRECAELFADLGTIAVATADVPVRTRPRDFTLTEKDAARLRHQRRAWRPAILGAGLRRSFGGSLAALGLAGALMTGAVSLLGGAGSTASTLAQTDSRAGAPEVANGASQGGDLAVGSTAPASPAAAMGPLETSAGVATTGGKEASAQPSAPAPIPVSSNQFAVAPQQSGSFDGAGLTGKTTTSPDEPSRGGADARLVWLFGFGTPFGIGVAILILPWALRRRGRGTRR